MNKDNLNLWDLYRAKFSTAEENEQFYAFLYKVFEIDKRFPLHVSVKSEPTRREALRQAQKENGGMLTNEQIKELAKKYGWHGKAMCDYYKKIRSKLM